MSETDIFEDPEALRNFVNLYYTRIRDCWQYKEEYKSCKSITGKFHQYFIFGETLDCSEHKAKWKECKPCLYKNDLKACAKIIQKENQRRKDRIQAHLQNDVWTRRTEPPPDWNKELPEWAQEKVKGTFYNQQEVLKQSLKDSCVIM